MLIPVVMNLIEVLQLSRDVKEGGNRTRYQGSESMPTRYPNVGNIFIKL